MNIVARILNLLPKINNRTPSYAKLVPPSEGLVPDLTGVVFRKVYVQSSIVIHGWEVEGTEWILVPKDKVFHL